MQITTVGLDLAKNVFQVHGVNEHGKVELRKQLRRDQGLGVNHPAARDVDQDRPPLHHPEFLRADRSHNLGWHK